MMENNSSLIRVRVDMSEIGVPSIKQAWVCVDRTVLHTVEDFRRSLHHKFKLPENRKTSLYLQRCLLPDAETIFVLRDEDFIRVVYENLLSSDSQSVNFVDLSNDIKNPTGCFADNSNSDTYHPKVKKFRIPPVNTVLSSCDIYDKQTSPCRSRSFESVPLEVNSDIHLSKTELVKKKKHKKHKHLKDKKENNSTGNLFFSEERINGNASEVQERKASDDYESVNLFLPMENIQEDEIISPQKMTNSKQRKMEKRKRCSDNVDRLTKRIKDGCKLLVSDRNCTDAGTSKLGSFISCKEDIQNCEDRIGSSYEVQTSKQCKVVEDKLSTEIVDQCKERAFGVSEKLRDFVGVQEHISRNDEYMSSQIESKILDTEHLLPQEVCESVVDSSINKLSAELIALCKERAFGISEKLHDFVGVQEHISPNDECMSPQIESKIVDTEHLLPEEVCESVGSSINNVSPIQVEGDCTESLGNNCPKKKRRRRRKKNTHSVAKPSDSFVSSDFGDVLSSSMCSTEKSVSDFVHGVSDHRGRIHIKFADSPERSPEVETSDIKCSGDTRGQEISAHINLGESSHESLKMEISAPCETAFSEKCISGTSLNEKELFVPSGQGHGSSNQTVDASKSYFSYPALTKFPLVGDVIAYKVLELSDLYCPEVSEYKEGRITGFSADTLEVELFKKEVIVRTGKFENVYPDEEPECQVIKKVLVDYSELIEPKLISSSGI